MATKQGWTTAREKGKDSAGHSQAEAGASVSFPLVQQRSILRRDSARARQQKRLRGGGPIAHGAQRSRERISIRSSRPDAEPPADGSTGLPVSRSRTGSTFQLLGARTADEAERMSRSSVTGRRGDWPTEPLHTHDWHFPPGCGLSLFSPFDGQFGEQHEQACAEETPPVTTDSCDMQLIGQATKPRIVSSTWRVRNIEYKAVWAGGPPAIVSLCCPVLLSARPTRSFSGKT